MAMRNPNRLPAFIALGVALAIGGLACQSNHQSRHQPQRQHHTAPHPHATCGPMAPPRPLAGGLVNGALAVENVGGPVCLYGPRRTVIGIIITGEEVELECEKDNYDAVYVPAANNDRGQTGSIEASLAMVQQEQHGGDLSTVPQTCHAPTPAPTQSPTVAMSATPYSLAA